MSDTKKAKIILTIERLRFVENELFKLTSKYGVKDIEELDRRMAEGKLSESAVGEDIYLFDYYLAEKEVLEKQITKLDIKKQDIWKNLQNGI